MGRVDERRVEGYPGTAWRLGGGGDRESSLCNLTTEARVYTFTDQPTPSGALNSHGLRGKGVLRGMRNTCGDVGRSVGLGRWPCHGINVNSLCTYAESLDRTKLRGNGT